LVLQTSDIEITNNDINNGSTDTKPSLRIYLNCDNQPNCFNTYNALDSIDKYICNNKAIILGPQHTQYAIINQRQSANIGGGKSCKLNFNMHNNKIITACFLKNNDTITPMNDPQIDQIMSHLKRGSHIQALVHVKKFWFDKNGGTWGTELVLLQLMIIPNVKVPIQQQFTQYKIIDTNNNANNANDTNNNVLTLSEILLFI
jgi:hypothetical protein